MSKSVPNILFTADLSGKKLNKYGSGAFQISPVAFISIEYLIPSMWKDSVPDAYNAWVFTSKNAVKAVKPVIDELPVPEFIFAVGPKTARKLEKLSLEVMIPEEFNLEALARKMNEFELKEVVQFCGNLKAGNLEDLLADEVKVTSIEVYRTKLTPQKVDESKFDGIVFMSPSAVESFHKENSINENTPVFCIGPTTKKAAQKAGIRNCITPKQAALDSLFESIKTYYS